MLPQLAEHTVVVGCLVYHCFFELYFAECGGMWLVFEMVIHQ